MRRPLRMSRRDIILTAAAGVLAALAVTVMLASPVLAIILSAPPQSDGVSYSGPTIRVSTKAASGVTKNSATMNGFLESLGPYTEVWVGFEYVLNDGSSADPVATVTSLTKMTAPGAFSASASGLTSYTPYQFRATAESVVAGEQKVLGSYFAFHTLVDETPTPVTFSASSVSAITPTSAIITGYLSDMKSYNEVKVWFDWGTSSGFGNTGGVQVLHEPGPFSLKITGLSPDVRYYYRAGALPTIAGIATAYSTVDSFTTLGAGELVVSTWEATSVTTTSAVAAGNLESMGSYTSANVWFEYGTGTGYGYSTPMQTMYQTGFYTYNLRDLQPGTKYHVRALAIPGSLGWVTARGTDKAFTTVSLPGIVISTGLASAVTTDTAVLNGVVTSFGPSAVVNAWFEYGTDTTFGSNTQQQTLTKLGNYTYSITGLSPGTAYYFRSAAFADGRTARGDYSRFTTAAPAVLSVSTRDASLITSSSALLHAYINSTGGASSTKAWFNFGTVPEYGVSTPILTLNAAGDFSATASDLIADTTYYFQAATQAPDGKKAYGKQAIFKTAPLPKVAVSTVPASAVTDSSATLNGKLDNLGNAASVQTWFEYGTTEALGNVTIVRTLSSPIAFSSTIPVLPGTSYCYRAVALSPGSPAGPVTGTTVSFVSAAQPSPPLVSPVTSPYDWLIYCQRFISYEADKLFKSLNINLGK